MLMVSDPNNPNFRELIPPLASVEDRNEYDVRKWLFQTSSIQSAIAHAHMFWPRLVLHDDCVLWADFNVESFEGFLKQCEGDRSRVEEVMNHHHILDLFDQEDPSELQVVHLGRMLQGMWRAKLALDFPDRSINVSFFEPEVGDLVDFVITFYQVRIADG